MKDADRTPATTVPGSEAPGFYGFLSLIFKILIG